MKPRVVNVKFDRFDVYIGRNPELGEPIWGNPFRVPNAGTRTEVVEKYDTWIRGRLATKPGDVAVAKLALLMAASVGGPSFSGLRRGLEWPCGRELRDMLIALDGKTLGCHCKGKGGLGAVPCHGDPLAQIVNEVLEGKL